MDVVERVESLCPAEGSRVSTRLSPLLPRSFRLPSSSLGSFDFNHNAITPNGNPSLNWCSYETPPNFQTTSGDKNNSWMPENENEKLDTTG